MNYWLVKSEPGTYSWDNLEKDGKTCWDGVRNFKARNNLKAMKSGDHALFYHSGEQKAVVGVSKVIKEGYPDPSAKEGPWIAVDLSPVKKLKNPVTLAEVKADSQLTNMILARQPRLSVQPVTKEEYNLIVTKSK